VLLRVLIITVALAVVGLLQTFPTAPSPSASRDAVSSAQVTTQPMPPAVAAVTPRFIAVDIFIDSHQEKLAAYQLEFVDPTGASAIVGIEGGENPAFREPPYYDPAAMMNHRVILAAFSTGTDLPVGRTRVARLHLRVASATNPPFQLKVAVSATSDGRNIPVDATLR
jgi:hypothetical protein